MRRISQIVIEPHESRDQICRNVDFSSQTVCWFSTRNRLTNPMIKVKHCDITKDPLEEYESMCSSNGRSIDDVDSVDSCDEDRRPLEF